MLHANPEMFADVYRVVARLLIVKSMSKLFGFILLFGGSIMLYFGWQAHEAALASSIGTVPRATGSESVWLLTFGAVAVVWGLAISLRRRV